MINPDPTITNSYSKANVKTESIPDAPHLTSVDTVTLKDDINSTEKVTYIQNKNTHITADKLPQLTTPATPGNMTLEQCLGYFENLGKHNHIDSFNDSVKTTLLKREKMREELERRLLNEKLDESMAQIAFSSAIAALKNLSTRAEALNLAHDFHTSVDNQIPVFVPI